MKKKFLFPMNIQLFAEEDEKKKEDEKGGATLSYEMLKKENEQIKKEFDDFKKSISEEVSDIKNVILGNNKTGEPMNNKKDADAERREGYRKQLMESLKY